MWKSLPAHRAWAMPCGKFSPAICSWPVSGLTPTSSGRSRRSMKARAWPIGGQEDVAAGLVGLGLDREAQVVALLGDVVAQQVEGLLHPVQSDPHVLGTAGLGALAAAPGDIRAGAELGGQIDVADDLAQREPAHVTVVGGEPAVLEHRVREQVRRRHRDLHPGPLQRVLEPADQPRPLRLARPERDQVVVVERHPVRTQLREPLHRLDRVQRGTRRIPERVVATPPHGPETEGEPVRGSGGEAIRHCTASCST